MPDAPELLDGADEDGTVEATDDLVAPILAADAGEDQALEVSDDNNCAYEDVVSDTDSVITSPVQTSESAQHIPEPAEAADTFPAEMDKQTTFKAARIPLDFVNTAKVPHVVDGILAGTTGADTYVFVASNATAPVELQDGFNTATCPLHFGDAADDRPCYSYKEV
jgi:hypothetical protein